MKKKQVLVLAILAATQMGATDCGGLRKKPSQHPSRVDDFNHGLE